MKEHLVTGATTTITQRVEEVLTPHLATAGYDLILTEYVAGARVLRLFIDHPNGVRLDDCSRVSRLLSDVLDGEGVSDHIDGNFTLEVSSPGLDRPLTRPRDFQRFVGRDIKVVTRQPVGVPAAASDQGTGNVRKLRGQLRTADDAGIEVAVDGHSYSIAYAAIERARLVPEL